MYVPAMLNAVIIQSMCLDVKAINILDDDKIPEQALRAAAWSPARAVLAALWAVRLNFKDGAAKAGGEQGSG